MQIDLDDPIIAEVIERAKDHDRWIDQVAHTGYCYHPIRLKGRIRQADKVTGEIREVYSTDDEPDQTLLKACGNRRQSRCPSCAAVYRADAYQLVVAGLRGGRKGVPESVALHPKLFVTFPAPQLRDGALPEDERATPASLPSPRGNASVSARSAKVLLAASPGGRSPSRGTSLSRVFRPRGTGDLERSRS